MGLAWPVAMPCTPIDLLTSSAARLSPSSIHVVAPRVPFRLFVCTCLEQLEGGLDIWIWPMEACMSPALGYLDLQLDLPRNEGPTAEATRLTDKRKV